MIPVYREIKTDRTSWYRGSILERGREIDVCDHKHRTVSAALACAKTMIRRRAKVVPPVPSQQDSES
jgi:hypothetical protein